MKRVFTENLLTLFSEGELMCRKEMTKINGPLMRDAPVYDLLGDQVFTVAEAIRGMFIQRRSMWGIIE